MADLNTRPPIQYSRRSSLPRDIPPYTASASAAATLKSAAAEPATLSRQGSGSTSPPAPMLHRAQSSSSHPHHISTPSHSIPRDSMSSSSSFSSSSSGREPPSTAPSTPQLGIGGPSRVWRPTPNVPVTMRRRHRADHTTDNDPAVVGGSHRWLSDDEGSGRPSKMAGTRKREHRSSNTATQNDGYGSSGGGPSGGLVRSGSGSTSRPTTGRTKTKPPDRHESAFDAVARSKRPQARRAISMEHRSSTPPALPDVGAQPPRIADMVPPPTSQAAVAHGLGTSASTTYTTHVADGAAMTHDPADRKDVIPDFASGRGGDGISGVGHPSQSGSEERTTMGQDSYRKQRETLGRLRGILGW